MNRPSFQLLLLHARLITFVVATACLLSAGCQSDRGVEISQHKRIAGELRDNKLYQAAIEEYRAVLDSPGLDNIERGSISYLIAKIYFEDIKDYRSAAAYYTRARSYDPNGSFNDDASRSLVACLEKLGQFVDARREMGEATDIDRDTTGRGTTPVAVIAGDTIWLEEIDASIQTLPPEIQKQLTSSQAKVEFMRQYVGMELVRQAAVREGFDRESEYITARENAARNLLIDRYLARKLMTDLSVDSVDVRNFYAANRSTKYGDVPFDSISARVWQDYVTDKSQTAFVDYVGKLARSGQVTFMDQNVK